MMRTTLARMGGLIVIFLLVGVASPGTKIPEDIKNIVSFVYVQNEKGEIIPNGTAFFVGIPLAKDPSKMFMYIVTARHVIEDSNRRQYSRIWLRLNKKRGDPELVRVDFPAGKKVVFTHPTEGSADVAVIAGSPPQDTYDFKVLPADMLTSRESFKELKISEGSDVFFTGLFAQSVGQHRNLPIVRFGRVAMVSDEKIPWKERNREPELLDLYLIETQSFGGNSGSPVFFYLGADREPGAIIGGPPVIRLAGVMKGSFIEGEEIQVVETKLIPFSIQNVGIAAVMPSYLLQEILYSAELKKLRDAEEQNIH